MADHKTTITLALAEHSYTEITPPGSVLSSADCRGEG